jgi:hypothetical protein
LFGIAGMLLAAEAEFAARDVSAADAVAGAELYRAGRWGGAGVAARVEGGPRLPAGRSACAGCHGREPGPEGGGEGGVAAPALAHDRLARRGLDVTAPLATALGEGTLPDGSRLGAAMPRFALAPAAVADLLAYLSDPAAVDAPGVSPDRVRLGLLMPPTLAAAARPRLAAWAETLNADGGIWARRVELDTLPAEPAALDRRLAQAPPLALLAPAPSAGQREILARRRVPELAPLAPPLLPDPEGRVLALGPGLTELAAELAATLAGRPTRPPGAAPVPVFLPADPALTSRLLEAVRASLPAEAATPGEDLAKRADAAGAVLVLARPARLDALLRELPVGVVIAGPADLLADLVARPGAGGTWLLADPRGTVLPPPGDAPGGSTALDRHLAAATRLAEVGLERAGRRLTRPSLLAALAAAPVDLGGPAPLDYVKVPGRGATAATILEVEPAAGRLARLAPREEPGR